jgi:hypothetical protein
MAFLYLLEIANFIVLYPGDTCRTKTYPVGSSVIYGYGIPAY